MENAHDDPAHGRPMNSEGGTAGLAPAAAGAGVPCARGSRGPRIEVLRAGPTAAPESGSAPVAREPRIEVLESAGQDLPYADATGMPPAGPEPVSARRTGGRPFRPTMLSGLALLALLVLAGLLLFPYLRGESQDSGEEATAAGAAPEKIPDDEQVYKEPPPAEEPAAERAVADAALSDQLYSPESGDAALADRSIAPKVGDGVPSDQIDPPAIREAPLGDRSYPAEPRTTTAPSARGAPNREDAAPVDEPSTPTIPAEGASAPTPPVGPSALTTVRAFYTALSAGDGASAARFVVPAKRRSGPLSAGPLTRYYSAFRRPLRVLRVTAVDADTIRVAYDYVLADGRLCEGQSTVNVMESGDRPLISGIRAQGPC